MKRVFSAALSILAIFLIWSCNVNNSATDRINLQADTVLLSYTRVLVQHLDPQGNSVATLYNDSLRSLNDLSNLPVPGYHGGPVVISIKGYSGSTLVYDVVVHYDGSVATLTIVKPIHTIAMSIENPTDQDSDGFYSHYDLKVDVNTNSPLDTLGLVLEYRDSTSPSWLPLDSVNLTISRNSAADAITRSYTGYTHGLVDFRARIYSNAGELVGEEILLDVQEETPTEDIPYDFYIINHTGTYLTAILDADGQRDSVRINPFDTALAIHTNFSPYTLTYSVTSDGDAVIWQDTLSPGTETSDTVRLILGPSFYVLRMQDSSRYDIDQIIIDSGMATERTYYWNIPADGALYNLGAYPITTGGSVLFRNTVTLFSRKFTPLIYSRDPVYGYQYVTLSLF